MATYYDEDDRKRAIREAIMAAGFGMLSAQGQRGLAPLGYGGLLGMGQYRDSLQDARRQRLEEQQNKFRDLQTQIMERQMQRQQATDTALQNAAQMSPQALAGQGMPSLAPTTANAATLEARAGKMNDPYQRALAEARLLYSQGNRDAANEAIKQAQAFKATGKPIVLSPGAAAFSEAGEEIARNPEAGTTFERELIAAGLRPGTPEWQRAWDQRINKQTTSSPLATITNVLPGKGPEKLIEGVFADMKTAPQDLEEIDTNLRNINKIRYFIDKGAITGLVGPKWNIVKQVASELGIGADDPTIANTKGLLVSLAKLVLSERKGLKGQGQVSDYESRLAQLASGGDISLPKQAILDIIGMAEEAAMLRRDRLSKAMNAAQSGNWEEVWKQRMAVPAPPVRYTPQPQQPPMRTADEEAQFLRLEEMAREEERIRRWMEEQRRLNQAPAPPLSTRILP